MSLDFNVDPYYDDFKQTNNYHRILFKPGSAVQARELTQAQTILQDQVTKFADNIFKQNSPVTGGQVTTNFNCQYVKLNTTDTLGVAIDLTEWYDSTTNTGLLVRNADGSVIADVIQALPASGSNPPTLILSYKTGGHFQNNDIIYDVNSNLTLQAITQNAIGASSVASIAAGVFYILGNFVQIQPSTTVIDPYTNTPSRRIGLTITETIHDYIDDASLLDPAVGASNYQAPGADRYFISLTLDTRPVSFGDDQNFIELVRVDNGDVQKLVTGSVYNVIDEYFAKREYETNGDYVVNDFKLTPKTNTADSTNSTYIMSVGKGLAYVHGYRVENNVPVNLVTDRARTTSSQNNSPVSVNFGSYFYVDNVRGANTGFFDITTSQSIDLHCVPYANVSQSSATTYSSTVAAKAYIRGLEYDHNLSDATTSTYVYRAYVHTVSTQTPTGTAQTGTANTITFPSAYSTSNLAYVGATIYIPSTGDFRTITAYNGSTKVATVNQNFTAVPTGTTTFTLNYSIGNVQSLVSLNNSSQIIGKASVNNLNLNNQNVVSLQNANSPELLFNVGSPYVSSLKNTSYTTQQIFRGVQFTSSGSGITATLSYAGALNGIVRHFGTPSSTLSSSLVKQNYTIIVTDAGGNGSISNGDIVNWTSTGRSITLNSDASVATLSTTSSGGLSTFTADIIATVYVETADNTGYIRKYKKLVTANTQVYNINGTNVNSYTYVDDTTNSTGQIYITNHGLLGPGVKQSLYLSDVKQIVKIIDTGAPGIIPSVAMISDPAHDITNNYTFDNGQRDAIYDHASITLKPGAPQPSGNILVLVNYYQHSGGDGYFCVDSYLGSSSPDTYTGIQTYKSSGGTLYSLRDVVDFRPARLNAQSSFTFRYSSTGPNNYGLLLPTDLSIFTTDYSFYLGRKDKLVLNRDGNFAVIEGAPSLTPLLPAEPDGSLVLANLTLNPYTGYLPSEAPTGTVSDLDVSRVKHKRYTMQDISGLESRINQIEYYTSLSLLEQKASSLQISDAYGLNRFKNGIMVDDFSSYAAADTINGDYNATIDRRNHILTAGQNVQNFPFKSLALNYSLGNLANTVNLGYNISSDGLVNYFSLPYTTANVAAQKFASRTVNVNPYSFSTQQGTMSITPNVDNWVDTNYAPSLLITDPNLQVFQSSNNINVLSVGDWKTIPGTTQTTAVNTIGHGINPSPYGYVGYTTHTTYQQVSQTNIYGAYDSIGNTYSLNNGYITDISVLPYMRAQQIVVRAKYMLFNTPVDVYFDSVNVNEYFHKANVIELTNVNGSFNENDTIGYLNGSSFVPTGRVVGVYQEGPTSVRLYVAADSFTTTYGSTVVAGNFNATGAFVNTSGSGTLSSTSHFGGRLTAVNSRLSIKLNALASTADGYYVGNTIYINAGTGAGQYATITGYTGSTQTATLSSPGISASIGDIYSIGSFKTNESGAIYGVFNLPAGVFHTGQRVLQIDNSLGNPTAATTFATATFYAEGLQTTQQGVDFGASPAGAKNTFSATSGPKTISSSYTTPWDPVAQTFMIESINYPNGVFLSSVSLFFQTKPTSDNSPITLSIVGTLNGYPNGQTLDHSIVTLHPNDVNVSATPQYLDTTASTVFEFSAPVFIQPDVLYAFIVKSDSKNYNLWTASNGDTALLSSTKNLPSDPTPAAATKISGAPYVGALFTSQNSQTWTADQNQDMMFVLDRCVFDTTTQPVISFSIPRKLPQRTLYNQSLVYFGNANNVSNTADAISNTDILVDAFNLTTTDFIPTATSLSYSYNSTLSTGVAAGTTLVNPGKFGTPTNDDLYLNDGRGERILLANSDTSLTMSATLSTTDDSVSPIVSDAGLSAYVIQWNINNCELSNSLITLANVGSNYNVAYTTVTVSAPTGVGGTQAYAAANVNPSTGIINSVYFTYGGSGYITTPTLTITDSTNSGSNAVAIVAGETNTNGGNALARYVSKKVVLDQGFDSGDLNVFLTAYRPINTDINVYYKILNRNDTQTLENGSWQLMTKINNSGSSYSSDRNNLIEYSFAPGTSGTDQGFVSYTSTNGQTYTTFSQFAIKVVLTSSDHTFVPFITDLRAIALPPNINTTF